MGWKDHHRAERGYHHGNLREALIEAALRLIAEKGPGGFLAGIPSADHENLLLGEGIENVLGQPHRRRAEIHQRKSGRTENLNRRVR